MSVRFTPPDNNVPSALPIVRTPANGDLRCVVLSKRWVWAPTHWDGKRTVICDDSPTCEMCHKQSQLWKGFAVVRPLNGSAKSILSITDNVEPALASALSGGKDACGLICRFYRLGKQRNAPLACQVLGRKEGETPLDPLSTVRQIERIFRTTIDTFLLCNSPSAALSRPEIRLKRIP